MRVARAAALACALLLAACGGGALTVAPPRRGGTCVRQQPIARAAHRSRAALRASAAADVPLPAQPIGAAPARDAPADTIEWDAARRRWRRTLPQEPTSGLPSSLTRVVLRPLARLFLMRREAVTPDYYTFTFWRMAQRLLSAAKDVFATQALLGALGVRSDGAVGSVAAGAWIGKESLGRFSKIAWSGKMKATMDAEAKRVRVLTALLYPLGQSLEICCRWFPHAFLLLGTAGIFCKQIAQVSASATRNAFYRSFSADGTGGAIGEMTATGEAQVSLASAVGIAIGICASERLIRGRLCVFLPLYAALCAADAFAVYSEVRAVVCTRLNHERTAIVLRAWMGERRVAPPAEVAAAERIVRGAGVRRSFTAVGRLELPPDQLSRLLEPWAGGGAARAESVEGADEAFAVLPAWASRAPLGGASSAQPCHILLSAHARRQPSQILLAWLTHAHATERLRDVGAGDVEGAVVALRAARSAARHELPELTRALGQAGWQTNSFAYSPIGADDAAAFQLAASASAAERADDRHAQGGNAHAAGTAVAGRGHDTLAGRRAPSAADDDEMRRSTLSSSSSSAVADDSSA